MEPWQAEFVEIPNGGFLSRVQGSVVRGLHFLSCGVFNPPPEVPDSFRLGIASLTFGFAAACLATCRRLSPWVTAYAVLGLARIVPRRTRLLALACCLFLGEELLESFCPGPPIGPVLLAVLSELCWVKTMEKTLDHWFDVFVTVMFVFMGILMVFGFYPALLKYGPPLLESKAFHSALHSVVSDAAQESETGLGGRSPGMSQDGSGMAALTHLIPVLIFLVGAPAVSAVILIYCWMFRYMSRMVLGVVVTFCAWFGFFFLMRALNMPIRRDFLSKALLVNVCIVMYYAFARMTSFDWDLAKRRISLVSAGFILVLLFDTLLGVPEGEVSPEVLFASLCGCKLVYVAAENAME